MLIKKKKFKQQQILLKHFFKKNELKLLIENSLFKNHYNHYIFRTSFTVKNNNTDVNFFFQSRQKLICLQLLNKKVPSSKFLFSRFFLNKQLNSLKIANVTK